MIIPRLLQMFVDPDNLYGLKSDFFPRKTYKPLQLCNVTMPSYNTMQLTEQRETWHEIEASLEGSIMNQPKRSD